MVTPEAGSPAAIFVRALVKRFGDVVAVDGIDLEVPAGICFGLLGPNGAGKTTTSEIILGIQKPTSGEVAVLGQRWGRGHDRQLRARLGVALQETKFPERLTVRELVELFGSFYPRPRPTPEVVAEVGLTDKTNAWSMKLSGGQRQRLALACALVGDPELLILDEPTTGLDPQARLHIADLVRAYRGRGRTTILSTHYMDEAESLCDVVAVIDHGKVIALGSPAQLIAGLGGGQVVEVGFDGGGGIGDAELAALPGVRGVQHTADGILLTTSAPHVTVPAMLALAEERRTALARLATRQATLEDVFLSLTGRHLRDV
jgi:ABC-2 type transport system ATP-binding protein